MKRKYQKAVAGFMAGLMVLTSLAGLATTALAAETVEKDGFTYELLAESGGAKYYKIISYTGSNAEVVIPDTINSATEAVVDIGTDVFEGHDEITKLTIGKYMTRGNEFVFDDLVNVEEYDVAAGNTKYSADDGVLYRENMLLAYPKAKVGDYTVKYGTTSIGNRAFFDTEINTLTIPNTVNINNELNGSGDKFIYSFLGAKVGMYNYGSNTDGAIIIGDRLIAYGLDSSADLSTITEANPYAFYSEDHLDSVRDDIPDDVLTSVPFSFYSGEKYGMSTSYFNIDGKTAYCYDYGKLNPETVGAPDNYDELISSKATVDKVKAILYSGYPNDAFDLISETGVDDEAAKNITGHMIWKTVNSHNFDLDDIYGIEDYDAAEDYMEMLEEKVKNIPEEDLDDLELKFYHGNANSQGLVVVTKTTPPAPTRIEFSKQDATTSQELPGASIEIKQGNDVKYSWVSTNTPYVIKNMPDGDYTMVETIAPAGYKIATAINFTVTNGTVAGGKVVMYDELEDKVLEISKKDMATSNELPGATLKLLHNGAEYDTWVSTTETHKLINPPDGEYELIETIAPNGYELSSESIKFTIAGGVLPSEKIVMYNKAIPKTFTITKTDAATGNLLPGAELTLKLGNTVVDTWISTDQPHVITDPEDGTYTLIEVSAPDGYKVAESITFEVVDGEVVNGQIVMRDEPKPEPKPEKKPISGGYSGDDPKPIVKPEPEPIPEPTPEPVVEPEPIPEPVPEPEPVVVKPLIEREPVRTGDITSTLEIVFMMMAMLGFVFVIKKKENN